MDEHKKNGSEKLRRPKQIFPVVLRNNRKDGTILVDVVYSNRVENYKLVQTWTKKQINDDRKSNDCDQEWCPFEEIENLLNNGFRRVRDSKNKIHERVD